MNYFAGEKKMSRKIPSRRGLDFYNLRSLIRYPDGNDQPWRSMPVLFTCLCLAGLLFGCVPQTHSSVQHQLISLNADDLPTYGLAFITPSTVTGQEEEMQAVAFTFAEVLKKKRLDIPCITLPETLSAINQAGLAEDYKRMFEDYRDTGIFKRDTLQKIGEVTGARYLAQLKLSGFTQGSDGRLSVFGLRLIRTKNARIRLFLQIWDSATGTIAWEGVEELNYAVDTMTEEHITLRKILATAAENLISQLPKAAKSTAITSRQHSE